MRTHRWIIFSAIYAQFTVTAYATNCPDPQTTSLKWGVPPAPWTVNPYSPNRPQGDKNTLFVRANILVAGYGQGVVCTYRNSGGNIQSGGRFLLKFHLVLITIGLRH